MTRYSIAWVLSLLVATAIEGAAPPPSSLAVNGIMIADDGRMANITAGRIIVCHQGCQYGPGGPIAHMRCRGAACLGRRGALGFYRPTGWPKLEGVLFFRRNDSIRCEFFQGTQFPGDTCLIRSTFACNRNVSGKPKTLVMRGTLILAGPGADCRTRVTESN
jgi:hypothetical protein